MVHSAEPVTLFHVPQPHRTEADLRDAVATEMRARGQCVEVEVTCPLGGRVDIAVYSDGPEPVELIEIKRFDPIPAVGQILKYGHGWRKRPHLVILVPPSPFTDSPAVHSIIESAGIELRLCEPDPVLAWEGRRQARAAKRAELVATIESENARISEIRDEARREIDWIRQGIIRTQQELDDLQALEDHDRPGLVDSDLGQFSYERDQKRIWERIRKAKEATEASA